MNNQEDKMMCNAIDYPNNAPEFLRAFNDLNGGMYLCLCRGAGFGGSVTTAILLTKCTHANYRQVMQREASILGVQTEDEYFN